MVLLIPTQNKENFLCYRFVCQPIKTNETTPLIARNGILHYYYYYYNIQVELLLFTIASFLGIYIIKYEVLLSI